MSDIDIGTIMDAIDFFNPFDQVFIVHDRLGEEVEVPLTDVASYVHDGIIQTIILGSQIGAALAVLTMLLILTKAEKRRLPVFWLNSFTLLFSVIATILLCLFYTNSWYTPYARFTDDYTFVSTSAKATSIAAAIFQLLVLIGLQISLVLQIHVVSVTLDRWKRLSLMAVSIAIALVAIAFRIAQIIDNITYNIIRFEYNYSSQWLIQARDITLAISICFFSFVFCAKLGYSLRQRKQLGMTQFGPMQIIFIGGAQTLIIPGTSLLPFSSSCSSFPHFPPFSSSIPKLTTPSHLRHNPIHRPHNPHQLPHPHRHRHQSPTHLPLGLRRDLHPLKSHPRPRRAPEIPDEHPARYRRFLTQDIRP